MLLLLLQVEFAPAGILGQRGQTALIIFGVAFHLLEREEGRNKLGPKENQTPEVIGILFEWIGEVRRIQQLW